MDLVHVIKAQTKHPRQLVRRTRTIDDLGESIEPQVRAFVEAMRALFAETGMTFREFASTRPFSLTSISRYLSGERVPTDQHFRDDVLDFWVLQNNVPEDVASLVADRLAELQREALRVTNDSGYRKLTASENLAAAVHGRETEKKRVRKLERQLEEHKRQAMLTQNRLREIEGQVGRVEELESKALELAEDRARLLEEIARLTQELEEARQAQAEAEERCRKLELELEDADNDLERERLARQAQEQRGLIAQAMGIAEERLKNLESAEEQAEQTREAARAEAQRLAAEATSEAGKVRIAAVKKAENLLKEAEQKLETANHQAKDIVADANSTVDRARSEAERELAALANRSASIHAQLMNVKEALAALAGGGGIASERDLTEPRNWVNTQLTSMKDVLDVLSPAEDAPQQGVSEDRS